ncbi:hypothetical protein Q3G72_008465 [Acer saccharum]|nr:hypothetical protein Q3G72_001235 [Acer saccharum]KAK1570877.1 hypothetical protein Q3G72_008465 [Acer saccharum]
MMRPNNNAVIISYYVESPAVRSHLQKMKRQSFSKKPQTTRKLGSDRRLELLAYANDLRKTGSQQINPPGKRSTSKPKSWKWCSAPAKFQVLFLQICQGSKGEWDYMRMASEEKTQTDPLDGVNSRKKRSSAERSRTKPHFCVHYYYYITPSKILFLFSVVCITEFDNISDRNQGNVADLGEQNIP